MREADFTFSGSWASGENVAYQSERGASGFFDDVANLHDALMNSSGHRANILNSNFDYVGIGIEYGDYKGYDVVMITQNFAKTSASVTLDNGQTAPAVVAAPIVIAPPPEPEVELIRGTNGNDVLRGGSDDEELVGLGGKDALRGGSGNDTLDGGSGNDRLRGGSGEDVLKGGTGLDRAEYSDAGYGVRVNLAQASKNTGDADGDTYSSIEWLTGSQHSDVLVGTNSANRFWGTKGHDEIYGMDGNDVLRGGSGNDKLHGQGGNDVMYGNGGHDDFIFTHGAGRDVVKDFQDDKDELDFTALNFATKSALFARADQVNDDVVFRFSDANSVTVEDMTIGELQNDVLI